MAQIGIASSLLSCMEGMGEGVEGGEVGDARSRMVIGV